MSKITIELFDLKAEMVSFTDDGDYSLSFDFSDELDGYICLGKNTLKIKGRECVVNARHLEDGEYLPRLLLPTGSIDLPKIKVCCGIVAPTDEGASFVRELSLRERRLEERVYRLERQLDELNNKIVGGRLFG